MDKLIVQGVNLVEFRGVPYVASRHPGNVSIDEFIANPELGANCQLFMLGILRRVGSCIDDKSFIDQGERFGSKELWLDTQFTQVIAEKEVTENIESLWAIPLEEFDIYFFAPRGMNPRPNQEELKKLHPAMRLGRIEEWENGNHYRILHNAKPGPSALWTMRDFYQKGYSLFGIKRPIRTNA